MKNLYKNAIVVAVVLLLGVVAVACGGGIQHERIITVSIQPQRYLLEQIVGDRFQVVSLLTQGSNPEAYEPNMTHLMDLEKSEAYFCIGNIGFELAIVEKAKTENPDLKVYNNSEDVKFLQGSHGAEHKDHSHEIDPHVWTSVPNAVVIAKNMLDAVVELDPKHSKQYEQNYAKLKARLLKLDEELRAELDSIPCRAFLVWHPSLSYFARDYGLKQISMEYEGKEAPVAHLKREIDEAKQSRARVFFFQNEFDSRQVETVNGQIGARLVTINPMSYEWEKELKHIADALASK